MAGLTERQLAALLGQRFQTSSANVRVGIGDDAAVLTEQPGLWVASVDASVEGVHFDRAYLSLEDVGYRAFQAAASDLAAMGATAVGALSALILPRGTSRVEIDQVTRGQAAASLACECPMVGGNISRGRELSLTTTVLGRCDRVLHRQGARAGEQLWVIGPLGLAAAGLAALRLRAGRRMRPFNEEGGPAAASERVPAERMSGAVQRCIRAWRRPEALLTRGVELARFASAAIDVSDGLAADAWQLARASAVRIVIQRERLRSVLERELLAASRLLRRSALHFALYGGEDYALLATGPSALRPDWAQAIGYVTRGTGAVLASERGFMPLGRGYDHLVRD